MCEAGGIVLRLPHHPSMGLTAIFGAITPMILLGTSTFLSLRWLWFIPLYEASECVKRDVWEGKGEGRIMCEPFRVYQREKAGYTEPHAYLCQHLFLSLLIPSLLLCVAPPAHYLSFSLACFLFFAVSCSGSGSLFSCLLRCLKLIDST